MFLLEGRTAHRCSKILVTAESTCSIFARSQLAQGLLNTDFIGSNLKTKIPKCEVQNVTDVLPRVQLRHTKSRSTPFEGSRTELMCVTISVSHIPDFGGNLDLWRQLHIPAERSTSRCVGEMCLCASADGACGSCVTPISRCKAQP